LETLPCTRSLKVYGYRKPYKKEKGIAGAVLPVRVGESPALTKKIKLVFIIYLSYLLFSFFLFTTHYISPLVLLRKNQIPLKIVMANTIERVVKFINPSPTVINKAEKEVVIPASTVQKG